MKVDVSENVVNGKVLKKCKKDKKGVDDNDKFKKKKKKKENGVVSDLNAEDSLLNKDNPENKNELGSGSTDEQITDESLISFNENILSNLQMQFEKVAEEIETDNKVPSACDEPETSVNGSVSKKRKRTKTKDGRKTQNAEPAEQENADGAKSAYQSVKKVRFSMKNNLVWKPQSPLPPQSLRLPPSVTPRGSALKKGVCPGPVREFAIATKKTKRAKAVKKVRKVVKSIGRKKLTSLTA
jgi:ribosomal RNA-processing protein 1